MPLNKRRVGVVDAAFSSMASASAGSATAASTEKDENDAGTIPLVKAVGRMNPEGHPEVAAGRLGPQEVRAMRLGVRSMSLFLAAGHQAVTLNDLVCDDVRFLSPTNSTRSIQLWPGLTFAASISCCGGPSKTLFYDLLGVNGGNMKVYLPAARSRSCALLADVGCAPCATGPMVW